MRAIGCDENTRNGAEALTATQYIIAKVLHLRPRNSNRKMTRPITYNYWHIDTLIIRENNRLTTVWPLIT
jgi:hypothetical protein